MWNVVWWFVQIIKGNNNNEGTTWAQTGAPLIKIIWFINWSSTFTDWKHLQFYLNYPNIIIALGIWSTCWCGNFAYLLFSYLGYHYHIPHTTTATIALVSREWESPAWYSVLSWKIDGLHRLCWQELSISLGEQYTTLTQPSLPYNSIYNLLHCK